MAHHTTTQQSNWTAYPDATCQLLTKRCRVVMLCQFGVCMRVLTSVCHFSSSTRLCGDCVCLNSQARRPWMASMMAISPSLTQTWTGKWLWRPQQNPPLPVTNARKRIRKHASMWRRRMCANTPTWLPTAWQSCPRQSRSSRTSTRPKEQSRRHSTKVNAGLDA